MSENTHNQLDHTRGLCPEKSPEYKKMLGMIGIAKRAGSVVSGVSAVISEIRSDKRRQKIGIVLLSDGCSKNTGKQIAGACVYYNVPMRKISVSPGDLGHAIGKKGDICAVAVMKTAKAGGRIPEAVIGKIDDFEQIKHLGLTVKS